MKTKLREQNENNIYSKCNLSQFTKNILRTFIGFEQRKTLFKFQRFDVKRVLRLNPKNYAASKISYILIKKTKSFVNF